MRWGEDCWALRLRCLWLVSAALNDHEFKRIKNPRSLSVAEADNAAELCRDAINRVCTQQIPNKQRAFRLRSTTQNPRSLSVAEANLYRRCTATSP